MKEDKNKIKEPYKPENTPEPPQRIDPDTERKRENPVQEKPGSSDEPANKADRKSEKSHLLSEDADIEDETTI